MTAHATCENGDKDGAHGTKLVPMGSRHKRLGFTACAGSEFAGEFTLTLRANLGASQLLSPTGGAGVASPPALSHL